VIIDSQVFRRILDGRKEMFEEDQGKWFRKDGVSQKEIKDLESALKHPLFPDSAYMSLPDWNLFTGVPSCELHALTLGLFEHIVRAIFHGYEAVLRRSDLVHADGKPLVGDLRLKLHIHRLEHRLQELNPDESIFTFQPCQVTLFHKVYHDQDSGAKMTGDNVKRLMLILPFLIRDLIKPEVNFRASPNTKNIHDMWFHTVSYCFILFHTVSHCFVSIYKL
jgi:hypothetical protein